MIEGILIIVGIMSDENKQVGNGNRAAKLGQDQQ